VKSTLQADTGTADKSVLFVTDSESDFCDDGDSQCSADALTYRIQDLFLANIRTVVFGAPSALSLISTTVLQNLANAGTGQAVVFPSPVTSGSNLYFECMGRPGWMSVWTGAGRTGQTPIATYGSPAGTAMTYGTSSPRTPPPPARPGV